MVVESLREQAELTRESYKEYRENLRIRDALIKEAREIKIPWPIIEEATGITSQTARISMGKMQSPEQAEHKANRNGEQP